MSNQDGFQPEWVSAPGETISDILTVKRISEAEFAARMNLPVAEARGLFEGKKNIDSRIAKQLEVVLGGSEEFWIAREEQFRADLIRFQGDTAETVNWMRDLPISDMKRLGWIDSSAKSDSAVSQLLNFFQVPSVAAWRSAYSGVLSAAAFRASPSFELRPSSVAAWLRWGEIQAQNIVCRGWNKAAFNRALPSFRALTKRKDPNLFLSELQRRCAEYGVALVVGRTPAGCPTSGATKFVEKNKALLMLSFRHMSDDHFWFSFFHEAGHLVLHDKKALFLDGSDMAISDEEDEANHFAMNILIPKEYQSELDRVPIKTKSIIRLAVHLGISPGIVVGQLQYRRRIAMTQMNHLKRRFKWRDNSPVSSHETV